MAEEEYTTIRVSRSTQKRLNALGTMKDDYDSVIIQILDFVDKENTRRKVKKNGDIIKVEE